MAETAGISLSGCSETKFLSLQYQYLYMNKVTRTIKPHCTKLNLKYSTKLDHHRHHPLSSTLMLRDVMGLLRRGMMTHIIIFSNPPNLHFQQVPFSIPTLPQLNASGTSFLDVTYRPRHHESEISSLVVLARSCPHSPQLQHLPAKQHQKRTSE